MDLIQQLKRDEGLRLTAYRDTLGFWTIGYGHHDGSVKLGDTITEAEAETLLIADIKVAAKRLIDTCPWMATLDEVRFAALVNMSFQLGNKVFQFKKTLGHLRNKEYNKIVEQGMKSLWAKQTPNRAKRVLSQLATGRWH